ncbi:RNA polymerase sigma factor [Steroidobacter sp.]|uniref:RNA polymerase sigma factor n=1 Tax=Steroidobacter sp. TaxID=1978227 RepID=UPI001A396B07|nr:RNA polymerase sigma factor [Steroidobacter sp.]MBL8267678.1 RNA polymerase sigma factor [Steroidobacter sp.]
MIDRYKQSPGADRWSSSRQEEHGEQADYRPEEAKPAAAAAPRDTRDGRLIEWFGKWRKPIRSWLRNRASVPPGDIDDLAQEVFLRLLRYSDDIAVDNPQGYLFRIAANVANEWRERSRIRRPHDDSWLEELQVESGDEPENAFARTRTNEYVQAAVDRLPPRQREVLLLHVNEGLTYKQIAEAKGLTYRIVLRDLTRAYSALRMQLRLEDL